MVECTRDLCLNDWMRVWPPHTAPGNSSMRTHIEQYADTYIAVWGHICSSSYECTRHLPISNRLIWVLLCATRGKCHIQWPVLVLLMPLEPYIHIYIYTHMCRYIFRYLNWKLNEKVKLYIVCQFGLYNVLHLYPQLFQCEKVLYSWLWDFFLRIMLRFVALVMGQTLSIPLKRNLNNENPSWTRFPQSAVPPIVPMFLAHTVACTEGTCRDKSTSPPHTHTLSLSISRCLHRYLYLSNPLPIAFLSFSRLCPPALSHHILDKKNMFWPVLPGVHGMSSYSSYIMARTQRALRQQSVKNLLG